jgi:hypothetical protein
LLGETSAISRDPAARTCLCYSTMHAGRGLQNRISRFKNKSAVRLSTASRILFWSFRQRGSPVAFFVPGCSRLCSRYWHLVGSFTTQRTVDHQRMKRACCYA